MVAGSVRLAPAAALQNSCSASRDEPPVRLCTRFGFIRMIEFTSKSMPHSQETAETILVVDDTEFVLSTVVDILRRAGFQVLSAGSGPLAVKLAAATSEPIHLLLSDVDMPGMSGPTSGSY